MGGSTQGGDGKELGRFMELGSSYVCVWRVVYVGRVGPSSYYHRHAGYFSRTLNQNTVSLDSTTSRKVCQLHVLGSNYSIYETKAPQDVE